MLLRIEERLTRERSSGEASLLSVLSEALAIDATRFTECAFWMAFWGQVSVDRKLKRLNVWVHREYMRLFTRCLAEHWPEWREWRRPVRDQVLRSVTTCINGLTAGAVTSPRDWPARRQIEQLGLHLDLLRRWASRLRDVPDFPVTGVTFKDFTPLLSDGPALRAVVQDISGRYAGQVDVVVGIEARGLILGAAVAYALGIGFVPVRKAGKLPRQTHSAEYKLEYGSAVIEGHTDAFVRSEEHTSE